MAYLGAFRHLRYLNIAECHRITSSSLWPITGTYSCFPYFDFETNALSYNKYSLSYS